MKALLATLVTCWATGAFAQAWCVEGAQWHHEYAYTAWGDVGYVETQYEGDFPFADSLCQRFVRMEHIYSYQTNTVHETGPFTWYTHTGPDGLVYAWEGASFDTLFHFNAVPGDRWHFPNMGWAGAPLITVTDTGHLAIDGLPLRFLAVNATLDDIIQVQDTIIERIGPMNLFLDVAISYQFMIDGGLGELRCYTDPVLALTHVEGSCTIALGTAPTLETTAIRPYPNPSTGALRLSLSDLGWTTARITIRDMQGRLMAEAVLHKDTPELDLRELPAGCYVVQASDAQGERLTANWMKQ